MGRQLSKSRTFAIVPTKAALGVWFLWRVTDAIAGKSWLEVDPFPTLWAEGKVDQIIQLLVRAGLTVRYYDSEEKQWMDQSTQFGLLRAPGNRDGTWGPPTTTGEFEEQYLKTV